MSATYAYKMQDERTVEVIDLDFAAYCLLRGMSEVARMEHPPRRARTARGRPAPVHYLFTFHADEATMQQMAVDFANSESARFAECVRRLKKFTPRHIT